MSGKNLETIPWAEVIGPDYIFALLCEIDFASKLNIETLYTHDQMIMDRQRPDTNTLVWANRNWPVVSYIEKVFTDICEVFCCMRVDFKIWHWLRALCPAKLLLNS